MKLFLSQWKNWKLDVLLFSEKVDGLDYRILRVSSAPEKFKLIPENN